MSRNRIINWLMAIAIAAMLGIVIDQPEPKPQTSAASARQLAFEQCGDGAALEWKADGTLTCRRHDGRGKATLVAGAGQ